MSDYYRQLRQKVGTERIFSPSVAAIIRDRDGKILFQRPDPASDTWSLPAGAIELGETPSQAIIREVYEETGIHVTPTSLIGAFGGEQFRYTYPDGNRVEYVVFVFECRIDSGELQPIDGESFALRFFTEGDVPRLALPYPKAMFHFSSRQGPLFN